MKDKPTKEMKMADMIASHQKTNKESVSNVTDEGIAGLEHSYAFAERDQKLEAYNERVTELDEDYASLKPMVRVLVRAFVRTPVKDPDTGVLLPMERPIKVPTKAGFGHIAVMDDPYPYTTKAVVVAAPEQSSYKAGDIVIMSEDPVQTIAVGQGEGAGVAIKDAFVHPDFSKSMLPPKNPEDKNYGYLIVAPHYILLKV